MERNAQSGLADPSSGFGGQEPLTMGRESGRRPAAKPSVPVAGLGLAPSLPISLIPFVRLSPIESFV